MTKEELDRMKAKPGLYVIAPGGIIVASLDGKIYGMVADNELRDEGWAEVTSVDRCILEGPVGRIGDRGTSGVTLHVLNIGHALCGKVGHPPKSWPTGHHWVSLSEYKVVQMPPELQWTWCAECLEAARRLEKLH